jgi:Fe2+ or Zn2+ uptake regulation protein
MIGYFASHKNPHPITLETIVQGCGIQTTRKPNQRQTVRNALDELIKAGFLDNYNLTNDILTVNRIETIAPTS